MFAVSEALYQPLQSMLRSVFPRLLNAIGDTFADYFRAPFQVAAQRAFFSHDLVVGKP
jgi:hypothetical protein